MGHYDILPFLGSNLVAWESKQQAIVAQSSVKAKYMASNDNSIK